MRRGVSPARAKKLAARQRRRSYPSRRVCRCAAYHFPHRRASGRCDHHPEAAKRQHEHFHGTSWETGERLR